MVNPFGHVTKIKSPKGNSLKIKVAQCWGLISKLTTKVKIKLQRSPIKLFVLNVFTKSGLYNFEVLNQCNTS